MEQNKVSLRIKISSVLRCRVLSAAARVQIRPLYGITGSGEDKAYVLKCQVTFNSKGKQFKCLLPGGLELAHLTETALSHQLTNVASSGAVVGMYDTLISPCLKTVTCFAVLIVITRVCNNSEASLVLNAVGHRTMILHSPH